MCKEQTKKMVRKWLKLWKKIIDRKESMYYTVRVCDEKTTQAKAPVESIFNIHFDKD